MAQVAHDDNGCQRVITLSRSPLTLQVKSLSRNTSFSGNLKGAKSVSDIEHIQHAQDAEDRQVIRLPRPCSRQNNASRSTTDMPRSVSFSNEEGRHRQCTRGLKSGALMIAATPTAKPPRVANLYPNLGLLLLVYNSRRRQPPACSDNRWTAQLQPYGGAPQPRQPTTLSPVSSQQLCSGLPPPAAGAAAGGTRGVSFQVQADTRWGDTVVLVGRLGEKVEVATAGVLVSLAAWRARPGLGSGRLCAFRRSAFAAPPP